MAFCLGTRPEGPGAAVEYGCPNPTFNDDQRAAREWNSSYRLKTKII